MNLYYKFIAQIASVIVSAIIAALAQANGNLSPIGWMNVVVVTLGAAAVLGAGELPAGVWAYTKIIVSAATAGAVLFTSLLAGGHIGYAQLLQVAAAILSTIAVASVPGPTVVVQAARVHNKFRG